MSRKIRAHRREVAMLLADQGDIEALAVPSARVQSSAGAGASAAGGVPGKAKGASAAVAANTQAQLEQAADRLILREKKKEHQAAEKMMRAGVNSMPTMFNTTTTTQDADGGGVGGNAAHDIWQRRKRARDLAEREEGAGINSSSGATGSAATWRPVIGKDGVTRWERYQQSASAVELLLADLDLLDPIATGGNTTDLRKSSPVLATSPAKKVGDTSKVQNVSCSTKRRQGPLFPALPTLTKELYEILDLATDCQPPAKMGGRIFTEKETFSIFNVVSRVGGNNYFAVLDRLNTALNKPNVDPPVSPSKIGKQSKTTTKNSMRKDEQGKQEDPNMKFTLEDVIFRHVSVSRSILSSLRRDLHEEAADELECLFNAGTSSGNKAPLKRNKKSAEPELSAAATEESHRLLTEELKIYQKEIDTQFERHPMQPAEAEAASTSAGAKTSKEENAAKAATGGNSSSFSSSYFYANYGHESKRRKLLRLQEDHKSFEDVYMTKLLKSQRSLKAQLGDLKRRTDADTEELSLQGLRSWEATIALGVGHGIAATFVQRNSKSGGSNENLFSHFADKLTSPNAGEAVNAETEEEDGSGRGGGKATSGGGASIAAVAAAREQMGGPYPAISEVGVITFESSSGIGSKKYFPEAGTAVQQLQGPQLSKLRALEQEVDKLLATRLRSSSNQSLLLLQQLRQTVGAIDYLTKVNKRGTMSIQACEAASTEGCTCISEVEEAEGGGFADAE